MALVSQIPRHRMPIDSHFTPVWTAEHAKDQGPRDHHRDVTIDFSPICISATDHFFAWSDYVAFPLERDGQSKTAHSCEYARPCRHGLALGASSFSRASLDRPAQARSHSPLRRPSSKRPDPPSPLALSCPFRHAGFGSQLQIPQVVQTCRSCASPIPARVRDLEISHTRLPRHQGTT